MSLLIIKAKPNPAGKDRVGRLFTPISQLASEWVDIQNVGVSNIRLDGVELYHWAYLTFTTGEWKLVSPLFGVLPAGKIIRVHSGNKINLSQMHVEDQVGADYHVFSGQNYVWNNKIKDFPSLWYKPTKQWLDQTDYEAPVLEGSVLNRVNYKLI